MHQNPNRDLECALEVVDRVAKFMRQHVIRPWKDGRRSRRLPRYAATFGILERVWGDDLRPRLEFIGCFIFGYCGSLAQLDTFLR